jgi:hypothetical protein
MRIRSKRVAIALGPITVAAVAVTALVVTPWASASHVTPTVKSGNPSCETVAPGGGLTELKVEPVASGTYSDGTLTVTLAVAGKSFDWSANRSVQFVIVKGGPSANVYDYGAGETADTGLKAPGNSGLSHVSFCYNPDGTPPPTTTTTTDPKEPPTTTTTTDPKEPPAARCTGFAYDLRLDLAGIIGGFVGGPVTSTDKDVFPDQETQSNVNVVFPFTGSTEPIVTATTLDTQNSVDAEGRCVTRVTYENLRVDLNNISPDQGIPVVLTAKALETITTAQLMGDGTVQTTSKFVLLGGSIDINGQGGAQDGEIPPNTGYTNEPECFANPNGEGKLCVTIMFHETSIIPNGIAANGVRIKVGLETPLPPTSSQLVDLKLAHAEADAHAS